MYSCRRWNSAGIACTRTRLARLTCIRMLQIRARINYYIHLVPFPRYKSRTSFICTETLSLRDTRHNLDIASILPTCRNLLCKIIIQCMELKYVGREITVVLTPVHSRHPAVMKSAKVTIATFHCVLISSRANTAARNNCTPTRAVNRVVIC